MIHKRARLLGLLLALTAALAGCSTSGSGGGGGSPAPTATLTASPTAITAGQNSFSTLTFTSTNADQGTIDNGEGPVGLNSHVTVSPAATTTYTYTATGPGGSATAQATVTVNPAPPPPTVNLTANPTTIFAGQKTTLTWTSTNAASVVITPTPGGVALNGSGPVFPTQTTTYTATATGNGQQVIFQATVTVSPVNSFDGIVQDPTTAPQEMDPNGAIGTKQFMEYVNTEYQAYDKTTFQPVWSAPQQIGTPWKSPLNTTEIEKCDGTPDGTGQQSGIQSDTVINFDRLESRWVIAAKATFANHYYFCIAVSATDDLASNPGWYAYFFSLDSVLGENAQNHYYFPDWPKLGTWPDSYYATMDLQDLDNGFAEVGVAICAFDRASMLAGAALSNSQMACLTPTVSLDKESGTYLGHSLIPADVDGTTPPAAGRDEFMVSIENPSISNNLNTSASINLWDFLPMNWAATTPTLTLNALTTLPVTSYTPGCYDFSGEPAETNCVPEPPTSIGQEVDSIGDRLMPRLSYRNFGTYESFLVSQTVQGSGTGPNPLQTGISWYEFRDDLTGTPSVYQQGTISPDTLLFRFLPSIAQDKTGNAAVGYSVSDRLTDPGISFSYWNLSTQTDPSEVTILSGTGEEVTTAAPYYGKWGTYSSMTVDPTDDCTFWYVNEYWPAGNASWSTRIAYFQLPGCQ
jgi:hypothetical protein